MTQRRGTSARLAPCILVLALLTATGCGERTSTPGGKDRSTTTWQGCSPDDVRAAGRSVGGGDFDADGSTDELWLLPASSRCPGLAVTLDSGVVGTAPDFELDGKGHTFALSDGRALAVLHGAAHPRGGAQPHVFGLDGDTLGEVTLNGEPVLPFVATDGGGTPTTATCTDDRGIEVVTATTAEPPGVVLAWDVQRTPYAIEGLAAIPEGEGSVQAGHTTRCCASRCRSCSLFADCRVRVAG